MFCYKLTMEDGIITYIKNHDDQYNFFSAVLRLPKDAIGFSADAWTLLDCDAAGILVHADNPTFCAKHNCLLSKDGTTLIKTCRHSHVEKLTGLTTIGSDAFNSPNGYLGNPPKKFSFRIPDGVKTLDYRAFAMAADQVEIIVPASVHFVDMLAFMIHSQHTHIIFEGDPELKVGVFGTAAEAADSDFELFHSLPAILYPKAENITVTCQPGTRISRYCKHYHIPEVSE